MLPGELGRLPFMRSAEWQTRGFTNETGGNLTDGLLPALVRVAELRQSARKKRGKFAPESIEDGFNGAKHDLFFRSSWRPYGAP